MRGFGILGAIYGALGVALGAFGAHALRNSFDETAMRIWHTAVEYQLWHALALLIVSFALPASRWRQASAFAFAIGVALFCGSLYALALGAPRFLGVITPFGGVALIAGWLTVALAYLRSSRD